VEKWSRRFRDGIGSVLAAVVLVGILVAVDGRARDGVERVASYLTQARWSAIASPLTGVISDLAANPQFGNMFLVSLVGAAAVLTVLMLRT
jgi:hypothetical protein